MPNYEHPRELLRFGDFELDPASGELRHAGSTIRLQPQPLKVLFALLRNPGELVTREQLKHELAADAPYGDIDHTINVAITKLRAALHDPSDKPQFIDTLPRRGYRFIGQIETAHSETGDIREHHASHDRHKFWRFLAGALALLGALTLVFVRLHRSNSRFPKHTVIIAAFTNSSGDPAFDNTLRPVIFALLQQSHAFDPLSDDQISQVLSFMAQPTGTPLTNELAREVCRRTASSVVVHGSILLMGSHYVLQLSAVNCRSGEVVAQEQYTSSRKEQVLEAVREGGLKLRRRLEESLPPEVQTAPRTESVTTPSFEALKSYSLGQRAMLDGHDDTVAIPLFQRAITLDPQFAMAYAQLGALYTSTGESTRAAQTLSRAYALRGQVSAPEQLFIEAHYTHMVTGNLEAARKMYASWMHLYPRDPVPLLSLAAIYGSLGECARAKPLLQEALRISPEDGTVYASMVDTELCLGNLDDARTVARDAAARAADTTRMHASLYLISFLQNDAAGMQNEISHLSGVPEWNSLLLCMEAKTAAYAGRIREARSLVRRATDLALLSDQPELAANCHADAAEWEALIGNRIEAKQQGQSALLIADNGDVIAKSAIALAMSGEPRAAAHLADQLAKRFPQGTLVQSSYLPTIRGAIALQAGHNSEAIEILTPALVYNDGNLLPVYLLGKSYLARDQGNLAGGEFEKILMRPGLFVGNPVGALAQLEIGRALFRVGDTERAMLAYQKFFNVWRNADPDLRLMRKAQAEYRQISRVSEKVLH